MSLIFRNVLLSLALASSALAHAQTIPEPQNDSVGSQWQWGGSWSIVGQRLSGADMVDASKRRQLNTRLDLELQREFQEQHARFYGQLRTGSGSGLQINTPIFTSAVNTTAFAGSDNHLHDIKSVLAQAWLQFDLDSIAKGLSVVAGKIDPTVFFEFNTTTAKNYFTGRGVPDQAVTVLDVDSFNPTATTDPFYEVKGGFAQAKAAAGDAAAVLQAYHGTLVPPFCNAAARAHRGSCKQHIRCRQNQQVRGHQGSGAEALA